MKSSENAQHQGALIPIPNSSGLHARPAAALAARAKKFQADIRLLKGSTTANAKSVVSIMGLGTQQGDMIQVSANGADAMEAVAVLSTLLSHGCGEASDQGPGTGLAGDLLESSSGPSMGVRGLRGVCASGGLAIGQVVQFQPTTFAVQEKGGTPALERLRLDAALQEARAEVEGLKQSDVRTVQAHILAAHLELLDDPDLLAAAMRGISQRRSAAYAWRSAFLEYAERLERLSGTHNALLRERGNDLRDIGRRVLAHLCAEESAPFALPDEAILIADELTPSDTASFDRSKLRGFCTRTGGATSHVAILARSFGIPALCGVDPAALALQDGTRVILDATLGVLLDQPSDAEFAGAQSQIAQQRARQVRDLRQAAVAARTLDGHAIEVVANVRNAKEAHDAVSLGAEGVGLLRSEFLFDGRDTAPDEEEQANAYAAVADALGPDRPLIVRTLDVGGDKPLPYLPLPKEDNPFLGLRGVRVSLAQPELLRTQLRAALRCAGHAQLHIMFPMVATLEELREARGILTEELRSMGTTHAVQVGLMIEVPSAALLAEHLAAEADFFSIGTNDLTQYTLAMDRGHPQLAAKADGLHPAVLKMVAMTCAGAQAHGKWVGVCGGLASDTLAVPALLGLGVTELSASAPAIPGIKSLIKRLAMKECQTLAQEVLRLRTAFEVRERLSTFADSKVE